MLFPYTTLFRSGTLQTGRGHCRSGHAAHGDIAGDQSGAHKRAFEIENFRVDAVFLKQARLAGSPEDRKSTRLNSSHRCISYAVFCLKKKTTNLLMPVLGSNEPFSIEIPSK